MYHPPRKRITTKTKQMENEKHQCNQIAKITLPWGSKLLNYCPVHANKIIMIGQAMGSPIQASLIAPTANIQCGSFDELTDEEMELNKQFNPFVIG